MIIWFMLFRLIPRKTNDETSQTMQKNTIFSHFEPILPILGQKWIFLILTKYHFKKQLMSGFQVLITIVAQQ